METKGNIYYYKSLKNDANIAIKLPAEVKEDLAALAEEQGKTISILTRDALIELLCEHYKK